jgi:nucleoside phosphorylase/CheY-like chemotaxis protein
MIKILIVDDEQAKKRAITEAALSVDGITQDAIEYASDVVEAKKAIKRCRFDLVILDINLPERADCIATAGSGLEVLRFIKNNNLAKPPAYLFGLTAHDDAAELAKEEFSSPLWKLVRFSHSDVGWKEPLRQALAFVLSSHKPPYASDGVTYHFDLGVFVALEDVELASILKLDGGWDEIKVPHDYTRYFQGTFSGEKGKVSVIVASAPRMGMPAAAVTASKLIHNFRPRIVAITGICAGIRGKAEIGDIIVADPCFDWGSGKWVSEKDGGALKFKPAAYQWRLDEPLRVGAKAISGEGSFLSKIHKDFVGEKPKNPPRVLIDAMASGGSVLQAASLMDDLRDQHKNLVGVEMESYAVFTAAEYSAEPRPRCISIKSVCDFGDETKADYAHEYAAYTSASFLLEFAVQNICIDRD